MNLKKILQKNKKFVIAEIGHNHQGSLSKAKDLILAAKNAGADAVKFQKDLTKNSILRSFIIKLMIIQIVMVKHMAFTETS